MTGVQATVRHFDPRTRTGDVLLDDGRALPFPAAAFDASGLRLLRLGQRDQDVAAVDRGFVRHRAAQVEHQAGTVAALHDVHAERDQSGNVMTFYVCKDNVRREWQRERVMRDLKYSQGGNSYLTRHSSEFSKR